MAEKLKVVWLTHFYDSNLESQLGIKNKGNDAAVWMREFADAFQNNTDYEIHIVSPNLYNRKTICFQNGSIFYHLYKYDLFYFPNSKINKVVSKLTRRLSFNYWTNFFFIKKRIKKIIDSINPAIIHLFGAENPYYSAAILQFIGKLPVLVSIQGFIKNSTVKRDFEIKYRIRLEKKIIKKNNIFGVLSHESAKELTAINPQAQCIFHHYPKARPHIVRNNLTTTKYDCVFFSRVVQSKGIEDLLKAIALIKLTVSNVNLLILGSVSNSYKDQLSRICKELNISDCVYWRGHLNSKELYEQVVSAKVAVLPSYAEVMPGMVNEAMYMRLPVVAYNVGGLPDLNIDGQSIHLVPVGDVNELTKVIADILLEKNPELVNRMLELAHIKSLPFFDKNLVFSELDNIYRELMP